MWTPHRLLLPARHLATCYPSRKTPPVWPYPKGACIFEFPAHNSRPASHHQQTQTQTPPPRTTLPQPRGIFSTKLSLTLASTCCHRDIEMYIQYYPTSLYYGSHYPDSQTTGDANFVVNQTRWGLSSHHEVVEAARQGMPLRDTKLPLARTHE